MLGASAESCSPQSMKRDQKIHSVGKMKKKIAIGKGTSKERHLNQRRYTEHNPYFKRKCLHRVMLRSNTVMYAFSNAKATI